MKVAHINGKITCQVFKKHGLAIGFIHGDIACKVFDYMAENPGKSATQIATATKQLPSTVSSYLKKWLDKGIVTRKMGTGPRGGATYFFAPPVNTVHAEGNTLFKS